MRALQLDFVRAPGLSRPQAAALAVTGAAVLTATVLTLVHLRDEVHALRDASPSGAPRVQRVPLQSRDSDETTRAALLQANQVVASLNLGWGALFKQLEQVQVSGVTLLAVQRDASQASQRRLRISGEARRLEDALAYVGQVAMTSGFANAHLVSHERVAETQPAAVRFTLLVDWVAPP